MCAATVQSIFSSLRLYKKIDPSKLNRKQRHVLADICSCRTKERGFHLDRCENCGDEILHYNSCQNPCCPKCQAVAKEIWSMKQEFYTLNIPYFHVVFMILVTTTFLAISVSMGNSTHSKCKTGPVKTEKMSVYVFLYSVSCY